MFYIEKMKINKMRSKKITILILSETIFEIVLGVEFFPGVSKYERMNEKL